MTAPAADEPSLESLLKNYARGDGQAFRQFFRRTSPLVYHVLRRRMSNPSEADDVLQDTYLSVHRHVTRFDPERKALSWLLAIAHNAMIDHFRSAKMQRQSAPLTENSHISDARNPEELLVIRDLIREASAALSEDELALLATRIIDGVSFEELSASLGVSPTSVRQRVSRALRKLRRS